VPTLVFNVKPRKMDGGRGQLGGILDLAVVLGRNEVLPLHPRNRKVEPGLTDGPVVRGDDLVWHVNHATSQYWRIDQLA
jgi:hypothetical protein